MIKCKYCGEEISKFDKDICPHCGGKNPFDPNEEETNDYTLVNIDSIKKDNKGYKYHFHKKSVNFLLCFFLGYFGIDAFYLGFKKEGILRLILNLVAYGLAFLLFYFVLSFKLWLSFLLAFCFIFAINIIVFICLLINRKKDKNGEFLK